MLGPRVLMPISYPRASLQTLTRAPRTHGPLPDRSGQYWLNAGCILPPHPLLALIVWSDEVQPCPRVPLSILVPLLLPAQARHYYPRLCTGLEMFSGFISS